MIKAIIFNSEIEAQAWDFANNDYDGDITMYKYETKPLTQTTTLTKAEYAELLNIPEHLEQYDEEVDDDVVIDNPEYTALESSYTLNKFGLLVGDDLDIHNEDGSVTVPDDVVDITDLLKVMSDTI